MNETTRHTPGPWTTEEGVRGTTVIIGDDAIVARLPDWPVEKEQQEANARLIAAAPELAEALRAAVERMEAVAEGIHVEKRSKGISQATHVRHMAGHLAQHAKLARAALEKAGAA